MDAAARSQYHPSRGCQLSLHRESPVLLTHTGSHSEKAHCECPGRWWEPRLTAVSLLQAVPAKGETKQDRCLKTELLREEGKGAGHSWASSDCT